MGGKIYNLSLVHGNHGYDNQADSMKSIFYARGPQLKQNFTLSNSSSLYNVDLFGLMCIILKIENCPPSNGSLEHIEPFLLDSTGVPYFNRTKGKRFSDLFILSIGKSTDNSNMISTYIDERK